MKHWLLMISLLLTTSAFANVSAYFNHNSRNSYTDPYRNIRRSGDNLEEIIYNQIMGASKSVYVAVQELRLPYIAQALIEKKKAGLDVRVVIENNYNFTVLRQRDTSEGEHEASKLTELQAFVDANRNRKFEKEELESRDAIYMLEKAGVPVMDDSFDSSRGSGLMHHKFVIVDGKNTIVTSANFTMSCIHGDYTGRASRGNANSLILVEGSANFAKIFLDEFSQLWGNGRRGNFGHKKTYRGPITTTVRGTKITVQFSPTSQRYNYQESVNGLIASQLAKATRSIKAALFVFSDQKLADVMQERSSKGAQVGVFIEPKFAFRDYSELLDLMGLEMKNRKCVYEPYNNPWQKPAREAGMANMANGDVLHHKFAVIDDKTVVVGSQNWSDAANFINDETLIVIHSTKISDQFGQEYNRIKRSSSLGAPSWIRQRIEKQERDCADAGRY